jgi:zinc transport system ATP-binding protein
MNPNVVELDNVSFAYNGAPVLADVNLRIRQGDFLAVLGPNGGGKTTLLKLMLGLLTPGRGAVRVFGEAPSRGRERVGYMPQLATAGREFPITALEVALMGRLGRSSWGWRYNRRETEGARQALERVGMADHAGRRMATLSGGQRQRVLIARALVTRPELLLLDEPTASVDAEGRSRLYDVLTELNRDVTIVVVSHDLSIVWNAVKSVACVNRSLFLHEGREITAEMVRMMYGGHPDADCPVELIAHGVPHRVLQPHRDEGHA